MNGNWAAGFLRSQLSDKDGTVSNTRVLLVLIVSHVLAWVSALVCLYAWFVIKTHSPVTMTDIVTFVGSEMCIRDRPECASPILRRCSLLSRFCRVCAPGLRLPLTARTARRRLN